MKQANMAPVYVGLYPEIAEVVRRHGYALAVHGSLAKDFDLICIPWIDEPSPHEDVIKELTDTFRVDNISCNPKAHGRICYTLIISVGTCYLDFSFMPLIKKEN
jgi:hypothetical protein